MVGKGSSANGGRDYRKVIQILESKPDIEKDSHHMWMIADCHASLGDDPAAIEWGTRSLALLPESVVTLELLVGCYHRTGDYDRAYQGICVALNRPPPEPQRLPRFLRGPLKLLSLIPRLKKAADPGRMEDSLIKSNQRQLKWREWARGYKSWYEETHGARRP
ncbi:MAG: tetratricopeptide repeat protein [Proteobacteria bacterium]|nr:tetratricopeptide repeat protein [Pseudomonadota bacterium]